MQSDSTRIPGRCAAPLALALSLAISSLAIAADPEPPGAVAHYDLKRGLALEGHDPVAYFTQNAAVEGKRSLSYTHRGAEYRFSTRAHLDAFRKDPARYLPAYGGWCAWAMVDGGKTSADPENFIVEGGRLFVFYRSFLVDTKEKWLDGDPAALERKADASWDEIVEQ